MGAIFYRQFQMYDPSYLLCIFSTQLTEIFFVFRFLKSTFGEKDQRTMDTRSYFVPLFNQIRKIPAFFT